MAFVTGNDLTNHSSIDTDSPNAQLSDMSSHDEHPIVGNRIIKGEGTPASTWQTWAGLSTLPALTLNSCFPKHQRVCIFAPHPDDEILGCAGLMQQLVAQGNTVLLVSVTHGTQSHPNSTQYTKEALHALRPKETARSLNVLGIAGKVDHVLLDIPDGEVLSNAAALYDQLVSLLMPGDILVPTFHLDGHPDHETVGNVVSQYAKAHQLACIQVLIWALHWAHPDDTRIDWSKVLRLDLTKTQQARKRQAIDCFTSQLHPDSSTGQAAVLPTYAITRATQGWELYFNDIA